MLFNDVLWEQKLKINTEGRDESCSDEHHQPYQPTYYAVLEHIASTGIINKNSVLVDYGCGKGRVLYFMFHSFGCRCIGIEREDKYIYRERIKKEKRISLGWDFILLSISLNKANTITHASSIHIRGHIPDCSINKLIFTLYAYTPAPK